MGSWTFEFSRKNLKRMSARSVLRYRAFQIRAKAGTAKANRLLRLNLRRPVTGPVWLREAGSDHVTYEEVMEAEVYRPTIARLQGCEWIVDLGANIGLASRYFLHHFRGARVLAVEPNPSSFALLQRNLAVVGHDRATLIEAAVWGETCSLALTDPGPEMRYDCVRTVRERFLARAATNTVAAYALPQLCRIHGWPRVDLLKVDIEGAETSVFSGDVSWLDCVRVIAIEFHGSSREKCGFDDLMVRHGFLIDASNRHTVIATRG